MASPAAQKHPPPATPLTPPAPLPTSCPYCDLTPALAARSGLHWHDHWRRVGWPEYVAVPALFATTLAIELAVEPNDEADWNRPILFDTPVRDVLRIDSAQGRVTAGTVSDVLVAWEILHPVVIDTLFVAWAWRDSPDVAWQMFVIDAQAFALTTLLNDITKRITSRARPWVQTGDCATNPDGEECGYGKPNRSFYSGHAANSATGAGLICAHHTQLRLYKNPILDTGTCVLAVVGTALTGALRISSDSHWATDVLTGHVLGYVSGYLVPTLLYYQEFRVVPEEDPRSFVAVPVPFVQDGALGLGVLGLF